MASTYLEPPSRRRRAIAVALTVAVHLLLALLLLNLAPDAIRKPFSDGLATFDVAPDAGPQASEAPRPRQQQRREREQAARPAPPRPSPPPPEVQLPAYLKLTREQFAATDLAALPKSAARGDTATDRDSASASADSASAQGIGAGPGGARVYNADWVREPTDAELRTYVPVPPPDSWAEIMCRMIANNRVENCQLLGESPRGSGLATGLRRAAWQFLIRPPRIDGQPVLGTWVCIHFEFSRHRVDRCVSRP